MWKTVIVESGERLTTEKNWLVIGHSGGETKLPIEDVYSVVIDNRSAAVSVQAITALTGSGAHIVVCDVLLGEGFANENYLDSNDLVVL